MIKKIITGSKGNCARLIISGNKFEYKQNDKLFEIQDLNVYLHSKNCGS